MKKRLAMVALLLASAAFCMPAEAGVDEVRLGVVYHDIRTDHGQLADPKEDGPNVEGELVYRSPGFLRFLGAPRPYLMASINVAGNTSFAATGLYWRWEFANGWALEPGFGYAIHNGEKDIPENLGRNTPASTAFEAQHQLLGSRDLFRDSIALEREMGPRSAWQIYYEHLSHGQILDKGRNQGLDEAGIRFLWRFKGSAAD